MKRKIKIKGRIVVTSKTTIRRRFSAHTHLSSPHIDYERELLQGENSHKYYIVGETPGAGTYICTTCDDWITTIDSDDLLPPCPNCDDSEAKYHEMD